MATRRLTAIGAATVGGLLSAGWAAAQNADHLVCHKVKDQDKTKVEAFVTLDALRDQFDPLGTCVVKGKAAMFCTRAIKTVQSLEVNGEPAVPFEIPGTYDVLDQVCYKLKCPKAEIAPLAVSDQFRSSTLEKFKTKLLCAPVEDGLLGTTTTTTSTTTTTMDVSSLVGNVYGIDPYAGTGNNVALENVSWILESWLDVEFFLRVDAVTGSAVQTTLIHSRDDLTAQDGCQKTWSMPDIPLSGFPDFDLQSAGLVVDRDSLSYVYADLRIVGRFAAMGGSLADVGFEMEIHTSPALDCAADPGCDPGDACSILATFGYACDDCLDGSGPDCVHYDFGSIPSTLSSVPVGDVGTGQQENHECVVNGTPACSNGANDDFDGLTDTDPECSPSNWP